MSALAPLLVVFAGGIMFGFGIGLSRRKGVPVKPNTEEWYRMNGVAEVGPLDREINAKILVIPILETFAKDLHKAQDIIVAPGKYRATVEVNLVPEKKP